MAKAASLSAGLVAKKGAAAPASAAASTPAKTPVQSSTPKEYFKALTVKLDKGRYTRLKQAGLVVDKTSQEIFVEALDSYLSQVLK